MQIARLAWGRAILVIVYRYQKKKAACHELCFIVMRINGLIMFSKHKIDRMDCDLWLSGDLFGDTTAPLNDLWTETVQLINGKLLVLE